MIRWSDRFSFRDSLSIWSQITNFMGSTWDPPGSCRPQMGPMLAPWTLLSGLSMGPENVSEKNHDGSRRSHPLQNPNKTLQILPRIHTSWWRHQIETFPCNWSFVRGTTGHRWITLTKNSDAEFSFWTSGWANNRDAGNLRRHCAHCDVTLMLLCCFAYDQWHIIHNLSNFVTCPMPMTIF